jgi:hypothetical protein
MSDNNKSRFRIFRTSEAPSIDESNHMEVVGMTPEIGEQALRSLQAGLDRAYDTRVVFACPTMSLTYAWFKSDYPLPRHSHDSDCLYYIMAGSIRFGHQTLGKGDGFFLPADMPYAYIAGPDGVELLEFRGTDHFNFKWLTSGSAFWEAAIKTAQNKREAWLTEQPPLGAGGQR